LLPDEKKKEIDATFKRKNFLGGKHQFGGGIVFFLRQILVLEAAGNPCSGSVIELIGFFRAVIALAAATPGPTRAALILASVIRILILVVRIFVLVRDILFVVL
jgi:hypothetical protein